MRQARIICADVMEGLGDMPDNHFDACLTDPPYGLEFMGKEWDRLGSAHQHIKRADEIDDPSKGRYLRHAVEYQGGRAAQDWHFKWAKTLIRTLKPGAPLLAFGGTRTHHRLMCALEDAGFAIRDCLMWLYGSGFPKSLDVSKAIDKAAGAERKNLGSGTRHGGGTVGAGSSYELPPDVPPVTAPATPLASRWNGYGTALKPAWEPIVLAMKPLDGTFAENAERWGVAGLWVDGGRIGAGVETWPATRSGGGGYMVKHRGDKGPTELTGDEPAGRWPANLLLDEEAAGMLDRGAGPQSSGGTPGRRFADKTRNTFGKFDGEENPNGIGGSSGRVSRFFYTAKAGSAERNRGLEGMERRKAHRYSEKGQGPLPQQTPSIGVMESNFHPTVKPLSLTAYLAKLILPPERDGEPRRLLVPFAGSGSEAIGAMRAGWEEVTAIELDPDYCEMARRRIEGDAPLLNRVNPTERPRSQRSKKGPSL